MSDQREEESLWEKVLAEHRANSSASKARDVYHMFILGDRLDGKESFTKYLQNGGVQDLDEEEEESKPLCGIGFTYGEWKEKPSGEDEETTIRILQTTIEKLPLKFLLPAYFLGGSLGPRSAETGIVVITVDLSVPYCAMQRLNDWYSFMEQSLKKTFADDPEAHDRLIAKMEDQLAFHQADPRQLAKQAAGGEDGDGTQSPRDLGRSSQSYQRLGIFSKGNLGLPLVVVCTKAHMLDLASQQYAKDPQEKQHFLNYVQGNLRKWCVERGAALIYVDNDRATADVVKEYILYRLANVPMKNMLDDRQQQNRRTPAGVKSDTKLFIPAFSDSLSYIAQLQIGPRFTDVPWSQVVPPPKSQKGNEPETIEKPKKYPEWLAECKKQAVPSNPFEQSAPVRQNFFKRPEQSVPIEKTAESFFTNMIRTYKKPDGKSPKPSK